MPKLPNDKHDMFAHGLAKGMSKADAYVHAGYNDSPPSATRLSQKPEVVQRVQEIRQDMMAAAKELIALPTEENAIAFAATGMTLEWCMEEFKDIAEKAKAAGQFAPANAAVKNIQGIIEMKTAKENGKDSDSDEPRIKLSDATEFAKALAALRNIPDTEGPTLIDVSPASDSDIFTEATNVDHTTGA